MRRIDLFYSQRTPLHELPCNVVKMDTSAVPVKGYVLTARTRLIR
jgi:hypothetical protein